MSLLGAAFRSMITKESVFGPRVVSDPSEYGLSYGYGSSAWSGMSITHETAMTMSAVYACIRLISDDIASMPANVYQRYPGARYERPKPAWMVKPNPEAPWHELVQQVVTSILLDGNAYISVVRSKQGDVRELWALDPRSVSPIRDPRTGNLVYVVDSKQSVKDLLHIRGITMPGQVKGLSPVECARQTIGLGLGAEKLGAKLMSNGSALNVVIKVPGKLDGDGAKRLAETWTEGHAGLDKAHKVAVVDQGADITQVGMTQEQVQFLATRAFEVEEICRWFGVPLHMVASIDKQTSWGTGVEQQHISYLQHALQPQLVRLEAAFNPLVVESLLDQSFYMKFNVNALLRGDMTARKEFYSSLQEHGDMSINEVRSLEDMNPIPGGDAHFFPMNFTGIDSIRDRAETAASLIRAGFDASASLAAVGLPDIPHLDVQPVTVRPIADDGTQLAPAKTDKTA
jgi:HK97 family phage portal protein